eukprot:CAMPEP_0202896704 /NCGR_PEP_ID=MMETSP1392-20130828/5649_1 /ASSEMBLY_ACC=CAM_ASM_000868 /TAXON_ID=225041 /ORGANISM="Chlamydomonas chlamydogama, Strain SAG 11-48b" /LENGTH=430 /DNA_ID=CAMNT_0049582149 /DNA_START=371 /DNA_END=1663 /DNA_ORIENTATION=+
MLLQACLPGANPFIEKHFHDCVYTTLDLIGFSLGFMSLGFWVTSQIPQYISNIKNQSSEALSVWFVAQLFLGDTLNLLGCLVQGQQLPTTTYLAMYFVMSDVFLLMQYIYYGALQARKKKQFERAASRIASMRKQASRHHSHRHHHHRHHSQLHSDQSTFLSLGRSFSDNIYEDQEAPEIADHAAVYGRPEVPLQPHDAPGAAPGTATTGASVATTVAVAAASTLSIVALGTAFWGSHLTQGASPYPSPQQSLQRHLLSSLGQTHHQQQGGLSSLADSAASSTGSSSGVLLHGIWGGAYWQEDPGDYDPDDGGSSWWTDPKFWQMVAGTLFGYMATVMYLSSRISQIVRNMRRRSAEGLAKAMFCLTMSANICTGFSILLRLRDMEQFRAQLPWICGAFGTVALDLTIFTQVVKYHKEKESEVQQPLLSS